MSRQYQNGNSPSATAQGPVTYRSPNFKSGCGCGVSTARPAREGFRFERMDAPAVAPAVPQAPAYAPPMCTLTATAPPAGCCNPAPLKNLRVKVSLR